MCSNFRKKSVCLYVTETSQTNQNLLQIKAKQQWKDRKEETVFKSKKKEKSENMSHELFTRLQM